MHILFSSWSMTQGLKIEVVFQARLLGGVCSMDSNTAALQDEIAYLKDALQRAEQKLATAKSQAVETSSAPNASALPMPLEDYKRYGRQMILEDFGLPGAHHMAIISVSY